MYPFRIFTSKYFGSSVGEVVHTSAEATGAWLILPGANLVTGNLTIDCPLLKTQETFGKFTLGYVYNAQNLEPWSLNIPEIIAVDENQLILKEADGSFVEYTWNEGEGAYFSPSDGTQRFHILKNTQDKGFTRIDPLNRTQTRFDASGKITHCFNASGACIAYEYADRKLSRIITDSGVYTLEGDETTRKIFFEDKNNTDKKLLATCKFEEYQVTKAIIGDDEFEILFQYDQLRRLTNITQTDGTELAFQYDARKLVALQQGKENTPYTFQYETRKTIVTDPLGFSNTAYFNTENIVTQWVACIGDTPENSSLFTTEYTYDQNNQLIKILKDCGASTTREYHSYGLVTRECQNEKIIEYAYDDFDPCTFALLLKREWHIDADGKPHWLVTRYVYETIEKENTKFSLLRFTVSPGGLVTEYEYDQSTRQITAEKKYFNAFDAQHLSEKTSLNYDELVNWSFNQTPNQNTLKTFVKNNRGQCTEANEFSEIDLHGQGVVNRSTAIVKTIYSPQGFVEREAERLTAAQSAGPRDPGDAITINTYDALGRNTSKTNALGEIQHIEIDDHNKIKTIEEPNGRKETLVWNSSGKTISAQTSVPDSPVTRTQTFQYDVKNHVIATVHSDGNTTYQFHDSFDRLRFIVTPLGRVTEFRYDDIHRFQQTIRYYHAFETLPHSIETLINFSHQYSTNERNSSMFEFFDTDGRVQYAVNERKALTEYRYDAQDRKTAVIAYQTSVSQEELCALQANQFSRTPDPKKDMVHRTDYDADGRIVATQDGEGYVTTHTYNAAGFEIYRHQYNATQEIFLNQSIEAPGLSLGDFGEYFYYDNKGREIARIIDGPDEAYVETHSYYPFGAICCETKYAQPSKHTPSTSLNPLEILPEEDTEDKKKSFEYDLLKRCIKTMSSDKTVREITYDNMGNATKESVGDDPEFFEHPVLQITEKKFNSWGQVIAIAPPLVQEKLAEIAYSDDLASSEKEDAINRIWENHTERYYYHEVTGLLAEKREVTPENSDGQTSRNILYFRDSDQRVILTVTSSGKATKIIPHPVFDKPLGVYQYANAVNPENLPNNTVFLTDVQLVQIVTENPQYDIRDQYEYDCAGGVILHTDPEGYQTQFYINAFGDWDKKLLPVDDSKKSLTVTRKFNQRRQCVEETKSSQDKSITTKKRYQHYTGKCTEETNGDNATTHFTYTSCGFTETITDPLGHTIVVQHDAFGRETVRTYPNNARKKISYHQNERTVSTEHYEDGGILISCSVGSQDAFGNTILLIDAEGNQTRTEYNKNNQWVLRTDAADNVTARQYDWRGLLIRETYQSDLGFQKTTENFYNGNHQVVKRKKDNIVTTYEHNVLNQPVKTVSNSARVKHFSSDRRGLLTQTAVSANEQHDVVTQQQYNADRHATDTKSTTTNTDESFNTKTEFDAFGHPVRHIVDPNHLSQAKTFSYNNTGQCVARTDAKNQTTFFVYDLNNNVRYKINPAGGVTEYRYNSGNKKISTIQYQLPIATNLLPGTLTEEAVSALITPSSYDNSTQFFYDALNQERFSINSLGAITEKRYNKNGQVIALIHYKNPIRKVLEGLSTKEIESFCQENKSNDDRITYHLFDALGQELVTIQPDGSVVEKCYCEAQGIVTVEIKYAQRLSNPADVSKKTIAEIRSIPTPSKNDQKNIWVHDSFDRVKYQISSTGVVTAYEYLDETSLITKKIVYKTPIPPESNYQSLSKILEGLRPTERSDTIEYTEYDNANRKIKHINPDGKYETWEYDGASRLSRHTSFSGHTTKYVYDTGNRLIEEISSDDLIYNTTFENSRVNLSVAQRSTQKNNTYDNNNNLTCVTTETYATDQSVVEYNYNALDQKIADQWSSLVIDDPTLPVVLSHRPEKAQTVSRSIVTNAHGLMSVTLNEENEASFRCYDVLGQLLYEVNALGYVTAYRRNTFGQIEQLTAYARPLSFNLEPYKKTGIPLAIITDAILTIKDDKKDNCVEFRYDQCGRMVEKKRKAVLCYSANQDLGARAKLEKISPISTAAFDVFGNVIVQSVLISENNWRHTLSWYNTTGNLIATVDENGVAKRYFYDAHCQLLREYTYANSVSRNQLLLLQSAIENDTVATYQTLLIALDAIQDPDNDEDKNYEYDILGRKTREYFSNATVQVITTENPPTVTNKKIQLEKKFTYTPEGLVKSITHPNGGVEIYYYNARSHLIAKAGVVRTQSDGSKIRPIEYYYYNAHGQQVGTCMPEKGCAIVLDPEDNTPPTFISSEKDKLDLFLRDQRNHILIHQDANGAQTHVTYNATGKQKRKYQAVTEGAPDTENHRVVNVDAHELSYDALGRIIKKEILRNNESKDTICYQRDAFEIVAEGPDDHAWPAKTVIDTAGRKRLITTESGFPTIQLYNAAGELTASVISHEVDLSCEENCSDEKIAEILSDRNSHRFAITETVYDVGGRRIKIIQPAQYVAHHQAQHAPKSFLQSHYFPQFGKYSLSFEAHLDPKRYPPLLKLTNQKNETLYLTPVYCEETQRFGVDITAIQPGNYQIDLYHTIGNASEYTFLPAYHWSTQWHYEAKSPATSVENANNNQVIAIQHHTFLPKDTKLHIWIERHGERGHWQPFEINTLDRQKNIVFLDKQTLPRGVHLYHLGNLEHTGQFYLTRGNETSFLAFSNGENGPLTRPVHQLEWSSFHKITKQTQPSGASTRFAHDNCYHRITRQVDPMVEVLDDQGEAKSVAPVTKIGRNELGGKISVTDAHNHTSLICRNEADVEIAHVNALGIKEWRHLLNAFDEIVTTITASGGCYEKIREKNTLRLITPSGKTWTYYFNENNTTIEIIPPQGAATGRVWYAPDIFNEIYAHYFEDGSSTQDDFDRHHQSRLHQAFSPGGDLEYEVARTLDYFGKELRKIDGEGSEFCADYFFSGFLKSIVQTKSGSAENQMLPFDSATNTYAQTTVATPPKNVHYEYTGGNQVYRITDKNPVSGQTLLQLSDSDGNLAYSKETTASGTVLRETVMLFDARHDPVTQTDTQFSLHYGKDAVRNTRRLHALCTVNNKQLERDAWWTFNAADWVLVDGGVRSPDGSIHPVFGGRCGYEPPTQGNEFFYDAQGNLSGQALFVPDFMSQYGQRNGFPAQFHYNTDGLITSVTRAPLIPVIPNATSLKLIATTVERNGNADLCVLVIGFSCSDFSQLAIDCRIMSGGRWFYVNNIAQIAQHNSYILQFYVSDMNFDRAVVHIGCTITVGNSVYQGITTRALCFPNNLNYYIPAEIEYTPDTLFKTLYLYRFSEDGTVSGKTRMLSAGYTAAGAVQDQYSNRDGDNLLDNGDTDTKYSNYNADHIPRNGLSISVARGTDGATSTVSQDTQTTVRYFDASVISKIVVTCVASYNTHPTYATSNRWFDSNHLLQSATNVVSLYRDQKSGDGCTVYVENSVNGRMLANIFVSHPVSANDVFKTCFFQTPQGNVVAQVGPLPHQPNTFVIQLVGNPIRPLSLSNLMMPLNAPVFEGDSWQTLSRRVFGSENMAAALQMYSGVPLIPNTTVNIAQAVTRYYKTYDAFPYEQLVNAFYNTLIAAIENPEAPPPPKPRHKHLWDEILGGILLIIVLCVVQPHLAAILVSAFHSTLLGVTAAGAAAGALANAIQQGVAIAFNDQHGFSVSQLLKFSGTIALSAGLSNFLKLDSVTSANLSTAMQRAAIFARQLALNAAIQLFEMGIRGGRGKFDAMLVLEQSISAVLQTEMTAELPELVKTTHGVAEELPGIASGAVFGHAPSAVDIASHAAGDFAVDTINTRVARHAVEAASKQDEATPHPAVTMVTHDAHQHHNGLWAEAMAEFAGAMNSEAGRWFMGVLTANAEVAENLNPISAMVEAGTGYDPVSHRSVTRGEAVTHFAVSTAGLFGGEIVAGTLRVVSTVAENSVGFFRSAGRRLAINASSPGEIAWSYGKLSQRQEKILERLTEPGHSLQLHKSHISPADLAALTAATGDEFGLFTLGSRRLIVRGSKVYLKISEELGDKLLSENWKWSAHTHPGLSDRVLMASGTPGDRQVLQEFNQDSSLILNSMGRRSVFTMKNDYAITNASDYSSSFRPGGY